MKNLCGQGRLYVKLAVSKDELLDRGNSDYELSKPTFFRTERALVIEENAASVESDQNSVTRTQYHSIPHLEFSLTLTSVWGVLSFLEQHHLI